MVHFFNLFNKLINVHYNGPMIQTLILNLFCMCKDLTSLDFK